MAAATDIVAAIYSICLLVTSIVLEVKVIDCPAPTCVVCACLARVLSRTLRSRTDFILQLCNVLSFPRRCVKMVVISD